MAARPTLIFTEVKMAALRIFARSAIARIHANRVAAGDSWKNTFPLTDQAQKRWVSIKVGAGRKEIEIELPDFEVSNDPKEWAYVEWTLREKLIPKAPTEVKNFPSGWKPQSAEAKLLPYFIERTKSHMVPVYLRRGDRGMRRTTYVRRIQGDIMLLEKELRAYLEEKDGKRIGSEINEPAGLVKFRGDYVTLCKKFLDEKGF